MNIQDRIYGFIDKQRHRFDTRHGDTFGSAAGDVLQHRDSLDIIIARYVDASARHGRLLLSRLDRMTEEQTVARSATSQELADLEESERLAKLIRLEIESFCLLARMLLNKVARFLEFYFGSGRGSTLDSHDHLVKNVILFAEERRLAKVHTIFELAAALKNSIPDFTDYSIAHHKSPRTMRPILSDIGGGPARIPLTELYTTEREVQIETRDLRELLSEIDAYLAAVVDFLELNRDRTALRQERPV